MSDIQARTPAQEAFEEGVRVGFYHDPDPTPEHEEETTRLARVVVEKAVAMHCGVEVNAFGYRTPGLEAYVAVHLATGARLDVRELLPNRMRQKDWALGFRVACRFGWFEGVYADPPMEDGGQGRGGYVCAVTEAGLGACLLAADLYRAHTERILTIGERWAITMERLRRDLDGLCRVVADVEAVAPGAWAEARTGSNCPGGAPGAAEAALRHRSQLYTRVSEAAILRTQESHAIIGEAERYMARATRVAGERNGMRR